MPTSGSATYRVATVNDATDEAPGSVTATVGGGTGYSGHNTASAASVTVNDNDGVGGGPPPGGGSPPGDEEEDDGGGGRGGGGVTRPRAAITVNAQCEDTFWRARTGTPVFFEDASTGTATSRRWEFGDGAWSRHRTVDHA